MLIVVDCRKQVTQLCKLNENKVEALKNRLKASLKQKVGRKRQNESACLCKNMCFWMLGDAQTATTIDYLELLKSEAKTS